MALGAFALMGIGAGLGLIKSGLIDRPREERDIALQATTAQFAPFTGLEADPSQIRRADPLGSALKFGATGFAQGLNLQRAEASEKFGKDFLDVLKQSGGISGQTQFQGPPLDTSPLDTSRITMPNVQGRRSPFSLLRGIVSGPGGIR